MDETLIVWLREQEWSGFAQSLADQYEAKGHLSEKQILAAESMRTKCLAKAAAKAVATVATVDETLVAGLYEKDGLVVKAYLTRGTKQMVGKVLTEIGETWEWVYGGKKALSGLTAAHKLTAETAAKFGGNTGQCVNCLAELTDERSIHVGYGPTCAKNHGWPYPASLALIGAFDLDPGEPTFPGAVILTGTAATGFA
jgi:hypothetical protein